MYFIVDHRGLVRIIEIPNHDAVKQLTLRRALALPVSGPVALAGCHVEARASRQSGLMVGSWRDRNQSFSSINWRCFFFARSLDEFSWGLKLSLVGHDWSFSG